ncbi:MAG: hypothetical protein U9R34_01220 [Nanoarchaeota archaeon]|nr:hypothetical protein [Nanoarchaeota archaeon]
MPNEIIYESLEKDIADEFVTFLDKTDYLKLQPVGKIGAVMDFCKRHDYDFKPVYASIQKREDEIKKNHAIRGAIISIMVRDCNTPITDFNKVSEIEKLVEKYRK